MTPEQTRKLRDYLKLRIMRRFDCASVAIIPSAEIRHKDVAEELNDVLDFIDMITQDETSELATARSLLAYSLSPVLSACGNSYINKCTEEWLLHAKRLGVYSGRTVGNVREIQEEWEASGDLPEWPKP